MNAFFKASALAAATASLATAVPASATSVYDTQFSAPGEQSYDHHRERYSDEDWRRGYRGGYDRYDRYGRYDRYDRPVYRETWRGRDGRYYCRKPDGTTGLIIGGAAGALIGRGIDGGRDRTVGTLLGAAGGALLGRAIERDGVRCR